MDRLGYVYYDALFVGILRESESGFNFTYDSIYLEKGIPIGFNFPFSNISYYSSSLFPIFENLVSEGWMLKLQSSVQHIDESDKFGILLHNGKDLIGAITVLKELM